MSGMEHDYSAITQMTRGDERQAAQLRGNLAVIARRTDDPSLRSLIEQVLAGTQSVRRVFEHPSFWAMTERNLRNLQEGLDRLDPEQREQLLDPEARHYTPDDDVAALQTGELTVEELDERAERERGRDDRR